MILGTGDKTERVFWMVYGEGQRAPTYKHDTADSARTEAARLSAQNPGISFYVLKAKYGVRTDKPNINGWSLKKRPPVDPNADPIPF